MDKRRKRKFEECRAQKPNLCRVVDELMKSKNPKRTAALLCMFLEDCPEVLDEGKREQNLIDNAG